MRLSGQRNARWCARHEGHHDSLRSVVIHDLAEVDVRARIGMPGPLAKSSTQLVGLLLQLPHVLRLHSQIAADFLDLAFDNVRQYGGSRFQCA